MRRPSYLVGSVETDDQDINDETIELEDERCELQSHEQTIIVGMVHILEVDHYVILCGHVISYIVVHYQPQQSV